MADGKWEEESEKRETTEDADLEAARGVVAVKVGWGGLAGAGWGMA